MITVKNLQNLNELLTQDELLNAIATHYTDMITDHEASKIFDGIVKMTQKHHDEIMTYIKDHE